jgi:hypothetical protein
MGLYQIVPAYRSRLPLSVRQQKLNQSKMKKIRKQILISAIAMLAVGALIGVTSQAENDLYQFCTTKAYGWPVPWIIEYCLCEGEKTVFPLSSIVINLTAIFASGLFAFLVTGILARKR